MTYLGVAVNVGDALGRVEIVDVDALVGAAGGEQVAVTVDVHLEQVAVLAERALELTQLLAALSDRVLTDHAVLRDRVDHALARTAATVGDAQVVECLLLGHVALTHKQLAATVVRRHLANHD